MPETKKYYHNLDVDNNKVINLLLNPLTTAQRTAVGGLLGPLDEGYVCFDTTLNQQYFWDGTQWIVVGGGGGTGTVTSIATSSPLTGGTITTSGTIGITQSSGSTNGYLSSADWTTFNTKEPAITAGTTSQYWRGDKTWQTFPTIPTVGTWGALNYPTWVSGTPFVKMTAAGTFALDTTTYQPLLTNPVTGTGTTNYIPKWSSSSALTDSQIFDNGTYVAIGTSTIGAGVIGTSNFGTNKEIYAYGGYNLGNVGSSGYIQTGMYRASSGNAVDFWAGNAIIAKYNYVGGGLGDTYTIQDSYNTGFATGVVNVLKINGVIGNTTVANTVEYNQVNISPSYSQLSPLGVPLGTGKIRGIYYNPSVGNINGSSHIAYQNTSGDIIHGNLATGGADEMVTVDTNGKLKKQVIPTGASVGFEMNFLLMGA